MPKKRKNIPKSDLQAQQNKVLTDDLNEIMKVRTKIKVEIKNPPIEGIVIPL